MENIKNNAWKIGLWCGAVLCALLVILSLNQIKLLFTPTAFPPATNTISVNGTGEIVTKPDIATFSFGVTETASTVSAAQTAASTKTNAAISALTSAGVAMDDIQTTSYNINPHYDYTTPPCVYNVNGTSMCPQGKSTLTGYDVSETIQVKVRDLTKAGSLFETVGSLGVQNVNDLQFSIDNVAAVKDQARSKAIADARANAGKLASELGVSLGRIVNFSEDNSGVIVPMMYSDKAMGVSSNAAQPPVIAQGQQKTTDNVTVTYEVR